MINRRSVRDSSRSKRNKISLNKLRRFRVISTSARSRGKSKSSARPGFPYLHVKCSVRSNVTGTRPAIRRSDSVLNAANALKTFSPGLFVVHSNETRGWLAGLVRYCNGSRFRRHTFESGFRLLNDAPNRSVGHIERRLDKTVRCKSRHRL